MAPYVLDGYEVAAAEEIADMFEGWGPERRGRRKLIGASVLEGTEPDIVA
jgi:hypothetical protein